MTGFISSLTKTVKSNGHMVNGASPQVKDTGAPDLNAVKAAVNGKTLSEREKLLAQLSSEEKIALLSGDDTWHTVAVERLGIPRVRVSILVRA
jgi:hypothetical protein